MRSKNKVSYSKIGDACGCSSQDPIRKQRPDRQQCYASTALLAGRLSIRDESSARSSMTLDSNLGVELFWIVSRVNNCHYCLGHQEAKLAKAGVSESTLAKLDTDWKDFSAEERYAFEFTKKLTDSPQSVSIADVQRLKELFGESKALEIIFLVSRYNSTNRWTDSTGIPQEDYRSFQTTLEQSELQKPSIVAVNSSEKRPELLSKEAWQVEIAKKAKRSSLFPLLEVEKVAEWTGLEGTQVPNHYRLLATFPIAGKPFVNQWQAVAKESLLPQHVPSVIAWIASRQDGAVYTQKMSFDQLRASGWSEESIFALDTGKDLPDVKLVSVVAFAKKLTIEPQKMTDDDLQSLLKDYSPQQTAEIIFHVGMSAFLNRLTESAQLPF